MLNKISFLKFMQKSKKRIQKFFWEINGDLIIEKDPKSRLWRKKINVLKTIDEDSSKLGVSMFNPTREHDTNLTRVFSG